MSNEWLRASVALDLVRGITSLAQAPRAICSRAHAGLVAARARKLIVGSKCEEDVDIPPSFWWAGGEDALTQNWGSGDFETWIDGRAHWRAYGVEFNRLDIESMLPRSPELAPPAKSQIGNYAPAAQCLSELESRTSAKAFEAQSLILKSCRAGLIPSRCQKIEWRVTDRYGAADLEEEQNVSIPDWFWDHCLDDADSVLNWQSGRFAARGDIDGDAYRTVVSGIRFEVRAILEIETETLARQSRTGELRQEPDATASNASNEVVRGRKLSELWTPWVAELIAHIHENGVPSGVGSQGQEELIKAIDDVFAFRGEKTLTRSTVQPVVQAVLDKLRSAEK